MTACGRTPSILFSDCKYRLVSKKKEINLKYMAEIKKTKNTDVPLNTSRKKTWTCKSGAKALLVIKFEFSASSETCFKVPAMQRRGLVS